MGPSHDSKGRISNRIKLMLEQVREKLPPAGINVSRLTVSTVIYGQLRKINSYSLEEIPFILIG